MAASYAFDRGRPRECISIPVRSVLLFTPATPPALVFAGDDQAAKEVVAGLIRDAGFDPVDAGDHARSADLEAFARLVIGIAYKQGKGPFVYRFESP